jgi:uncharacterized protein
MNKSEREELVSYRLQKAKNTLSEIKVLVDNKLWNTTVNRLYYACYYAVTALLIKNQISAQTHSGDRQMFGQHFIKTGEVNQEIGQYYSFIFNKRQTGDYDDFVDYSYDDIKDLLEPAKKLINEIERIIVAE